MQTKNKNVRQEILSQENEDEIEEVKNRNDLPDKERNIEEDASTDDEDEESDKNNKNQDSKIKVRYINNRDLLFLCRNNITYFVDTDGRPLDSGSRKLFERNKISCLRDLT